MINDIKNYIKSKEGHWKIKGRFEKESNKILQIKNKVMKIKIAQWMCEIAD